MYSSNLHKTSFDYLKTLHQILWFTYELLQFTICLAFLCFDMKTKMAKMNLGSVVLCCDFEIQNVKITIQNDI